MCGITGWVSYSRDLHEHRGTLSAMTQTMACRGPDASGEWVDSHIGLGHCRLGVIDLPGGAQPMTVEEEGRTILVTSYSGEIYNYRELRTELSGLGHRFRTNSDTEVALRAYLQWGESFTQHLIGMFALALWDPREEELFLVRDPMGIKPLYYYPTADGVLFGSEPKAILTHPQVSAIVDADGLAELLTYTKTPGHAVYRGMRELRPGHTLRVRRGSLTERRYWSLEAYEHRESLDETIEHVRGLLDDIVSRQLITDVPLCALLSGGLDSSIITALAAEKLTEQRLGPIQSFTVDYVGHAENFRAEEFISTPDGPYAHAVAKHVASDHRDVVLDTSQLMDPAVREAVLNARDLPLGSPSHDTSLYLLFRAVRERATVALSGESADELFGGYFWFHDDAAIKADTFPWLAVGLASESKQITHTQLVKPALLAELKLAAYERDRYHEALAEVPRLRGEGSLERRMREISYLHLTRFAQNLLDRKDRISMAVGLEVRVPYCDPRLVQYVFNVPWAMKAYDGREKSLLRGAGRGLLPDSVAQRAKAPYPATHDPGYADAVQRRLKELLADRDAPVWELADFPTAAEAIGSAPAEALRTSGDWLLMMDAWLRRYRVSLDV